MNWGVIPTNKEKHLTNTKHTLSLTDAEAYILACVMGNLRYNDNPGVNSLLRKVGVLSNTFNIDVEDYDKVSAYVDFNGGCEEGYKLCKSLFLTLDFDGGNVDLGENVKLTEEAVVKSPQGVLQELYTQLSQALEVFDTATIETCSKAIQRIQSTL